MNFSEYILGCAYRGLIYGLVLSVFGVIWLLINHQTSEDNVLTLIINVTLYIMILRILIGLITYIIMKNPISKVDSEKLLEYEENATKKDVAKASKYVKEGFFTFVYLSIYSSSCMTLSILNNYIYIWNWAPTELIKTLTVDYSWFYGSINAGIWGYVIGIGLLLIIIWRECILEGEEIEDFNEE
ncbi:MAG: hypothetical protein A4E25_02248 [Methanobacterium sp. PtaB.Bin024]|nr:MAG: hypothetical protein A4E25_02248 [Methanobacterium sp. PtaB.Bin024]